MQYTRASRTRLSLEPEEQMLHAFSFDSEKWCQCSKRSKEMYGQLIKRGSLVDGGPAIDGYGENNREQCLTDSHFSFPKVDSAFDLC